MKKICIQCQQEKPITDFYIAIRQPDGRMRDCIACRLLFYKNQMKAYREKKKAERRAKLESLTPGSADE